MRQLKIVSHVWESKGDTNALICTFMNIEGQTTQLNIIFSLQPQKFKDKNLVALENIFRILPKTKKLSMPHNPIIMSSNFFLPIIICHSKNENMRNYFHFFFVTYSYNDNNYYYNNIASHIKLILWEWTEKKCFWPNANEQCTKEGSFCFS